ncbi:MAG: DUF115 domain-containing protein [Rhodospirillales bacterium]|jgi:hypothetical protein|nr:DUF115 domain-containing protein [Rhodospirillales bacterium]
MRPVVEKDGALGLKLVANMERMTGDRNNQLAFDNALANAALLGRGHSLARLRDEGLGQEDSALVVAAGPSIKRRDPARAIKESGYRGTLVAAESALAYCLRNGIVPDLTVSLDPHPTRIVRWLGDPHLTEEHLKKDDYFARQDQDDAFADEMRANEKILGLLDRHGPDIRMALSTSASSAVVERVLETGMEIFWWNPMLDDPDDPAGLTARLQEANALPCVNAGGNVGTACWVMADAVLGKSEIGLTGVDFSYYSDTPYRNTQYYHEAVALIGEENLDAVFMRLHNPHMDEWFFTDPAYMWYRECFLEMAADTECATFNCTEGGILFGAGVEFVPLATFLERHA